MDELSTTGAAEMNHVGLGHHFITNSQADISKF